MITWCGNVHMHPSSGILVRETSEVGHPRAFPAGHSNARNNWDAGSAAEIWEEFSPQLHNYHKEDAFMVCCLSLHLNLVAAAVLCHVM